MIKAIAIAGIATFCCASGAQCQSRDKLPARDNGTERNEPANPADVPNWMAHAVGDILEDTGKAVDDATHDRR